MLDQFVEPEDFIPAPDYKDRIISELRWKLNNCVDTLKWYAGSRSIEERVNDNGDKAAETLVDINSNKN